MRPIDFRAVRAMVPAEAALKAIGWAPRRGQGAFGHGRCPLCGSGTPRWWPFHASPCGWFCHACKGGGNYLDLYAEVRRLGVVDAALQLCLTAGVDVPRLQRPPRPPRPPRERLRQPSGGAAGGFPPPPSSVPPCGPAHDAEDGQGGPAHGSG